MTVRQCWIHRFCTLTGRKEDEEARFSAQKSPIAARASASGAVGSGFESRPAHIKGVKMVLATPLLALPLKGYG